MGFKDAGKPHYLGHRERLRRRFRGAGSRRTGAALGDMQMVSSMLDASTAARGA